jgi:uncharacterized protein YjiK
MNAVVRLLPVVGSILCAVVVLGSTGCGREAAEPQLAGAGRCQCLRWDQAQAERLVWHAQNLVFDQDHALEASGLAASQRFLYVTSEKYATVLQIDMEDLTARVLPLQVPEHSELEGIDLRDGRLYMCDEAHAAVYRFDLGDESRFANGRVSDTLPATELALEGVDVVGGKIGFEGIAVMPGGERVFLLLERSGDAETGCVSIIYPLRVHGESLQLEGEPMVVLLEDCSWRLTALELCDGRLLALKTRFPGEEYVLLEIDPSTGDWWEFLDLTELARGVTADGWGNNLEGMAVALDGRLYLVSDNAVTDIVSAALPPPTSERAVLLSLPLDCPDQGPAE